jgi:hypothetical protein
VWTLKFGTKFKKDSKLTCEAAPSAPSVLNKITEIKQADHEDVTEYFSSHIKTMTEFKTKIDPNRFVLPLVELNAAQPAAYEAVTGDIKFLFTEHIWKTSTEMT